MVEEILYPSCSEMITQLNVTTIEDIRNILREIERITGWTVGITYTQEVPNEEERYVFQPININEIIIGDGTEDNDRPVLTIPHPPESRYGVRVTIAQPNERTTGRDYNYIGDDIDVYINYGLTEGITLMCDDYDSRAYPALAVINERFGSETRGRDGGGTSRFEHWLSNNGYGEPEDAEDDAEWHDAVTSKEECCCTIVPRIDLTKTKTGKRRRAKRKIGTAGLSVPSGVDWRKTIGK